LAHINKVLEIGFDNGHFLAYAREKGWNITGTEMNEGQVEVARELGFNVILAHELNRLDQEQFDLIVAFDVLEHIQQDNLPEFLVTIRRLLRLNGIFLARFPNGDSPFGLETQYGDITHVTVIGRGKIEYFSKQTGFHILYFGGEAQPILCGSMKHLLHRMVSVPIKTILEFVTIFSFCPDRESPSTLPTLQ
jgi:2-polyprenyl-3-methyl-5-hydroxy-6-metoxy-1,4-benzoquinol methylase